MTKSNLRPGFLPRNWKDIEKQITDKNICTNVTLPDGKILKWNPATEPNPLAVGGKSREYGFLYHPHMSKLGRFFQQTIKKSIISSLEKIHIMLLKYDKEAYVFDDSRLAALYKYCQDYTSSMCMQRSQGNVGRPAKIIMLGIDIAFFLMKEDIYYRARFFDAWNQMPTIAFELTEREKENLKRD